MGYYWPEGMLLETEENRYYLQNEETLQSAMRIGQILEGRALLCDYDHNLWVYGCAADHPRRRRPGNKRADGAGYRHHLPGE